MKILFLILIKILFFVCISHSQTASEKAHKEKVLLDYPQMEVTKINNPSEDYLFLDLTSGGISNLLIVDNELTPVFYSKLIGISQDFKFQPDGELTYTIGPSIIYGMDSSGVIINQFYAPPGNILDNHELRILVDGSYYILSKEYLIIDMSQYIQGGDTAAVVVSNNIVHMDSNDNELWIWRTIDHFDILDVDQYVDLTQHQINWTHCNSIDIDSDGNIILSTRNFDEVTKINRTTGEIIWRLGGERNQFTFINDYRKFSRQHCVRLLGNANLIMFDNGEYLLPEYSCLVEYKIDETNFTATLIRRFSRDESIFSRVLGSVQELTNGNILIGWGVNQNPAVTEINSLDSIEFELKFINFANQYRVYRFKWETNLFNVNSDSVVFNIVNVGDSSIAELNVSNPNNSAVTINDFFIDDNSFSVLNVLPITIPSKDSIILNLMFKPVAEGTYHGKLNIRYLTDTSLIGKQVYINGKTPLVSVENYDNPAIQFSLSQNFPNPFNPLTTITWGVSKGIHVSIKVYNILGKVIATLINEYAAAGNHKSEFNATSLPSGIYFYQMKAGNFIDTKKMILLR